MNNFAVFQALALAAEALAHSKPHADNYPEPRQRHIDALAAVRKQRDDLLALLRSEAEQGDDEKTLAQLPVSFAENDFVRYEGKG